MRRTTPRTILYVAWAPFFSGAERALLVLVENLDRSRYRPVVAVGVDGELASELRARRIETTHLPIVYSGARRLPSWSACVARFAWLARRERAALCHSNDIPSFQPAGYAARALRIPAVTHVRFPDTRAGFEWFAKPGFVKALFVSDSLRSDAVAEAPTIFGGRSEVVYDGVHVPPLVDADERRRLRSELGLPLEGTLVVLAGQVAEVKGLWDYIDAAALLLQRGVPVTFAVLGDDLKNQGALRIEAERVVGERGLAASIRFLGFRPQAQRLIPAFDIVAVPSHVEPLGNATLEAMASAVPVVGSRVGGIPEMVVDGVTGTLVPSRDPFSLARAIEALVCHPAQAQAFGQAGRKRALESFGIAAHVARVQSILRPGARPRRRFRVMRVLYLTMNPNRQSTTVPTEGWFRVLRDRGLEPIVVSNQAGAFHAWTTEQGVPSYEVPLPPPDRRRPWQFLRSLVRVVSIARRHGAELIHSNEHDVYPIAQYAARILRVPVVVSVHCTLLDGYSGWAFSGNRQPARVFFVSGSNREACRADIGNVVPEDRWRVLYNGIDLEHHRPDEALRREFRRSHGLEGTALAGVACALRPGKQLEQLFRAAVSLPPAARLVLAGGAIPGTEGYAERLLKEARELLGERLIYIGHQTDLRPVLNALDLFVNTSREESFGLSVLEAMACGCPVVGYPSVAVAEVVLPGGGEMVAQDDVTALAAAVEGFLERPEQFADARRAARRRAERFDIRRVADELWQEYAVVLGQGGGSSPERRAVRPRGVN